jgi:hypothetical protein
MPESHGKLLPKCGLGEMLLRDTWSGCGFGSCPASFANRRHECLGSQRNTQFVGINKVRVSTVADRTDAAPALSCVATVPQSNMKTPH